VLSASRCCPRIGPTWVRVRVARGVTRRGSLSRRRSSEALRVAREAGRGARPVCDPRPGPRRPRPGCREPRHRCQGCRALQGRRLEPGALGRVLLAPGPLPRLWTCLVARPAILGTPGTWRGGDSLPSCQVRRAAAPRRARPSPPPSSSQAGDFDAAAEAYSTALAEAPRSKSEPDPTGRSSTRSRGTSDRQPAAVPFNLLEPFQSARVH